MEGSVTAIPNVTGLAGDGIMVGETPLPERPEVCGLLESESEMLNVAVRRPSAEGVKVTFIEQLDPFGRELPHESVSEKSAASAPVKEMETLVTVMPVLLVSAKVAGLSELVVPATVFAKLWPVGVSVTVPMLAEDSNAPMSHGPLAGRGLPAASKHAAGAVPQTSDDKFFPVCHADDVLFVS
jgi:hypothetical protein